jgi:hypothetical protein
MLAAAPLAHPLRDIVDPDRASSGGGDRLAGTLISTVKGGAVVAQPLLARISRGSNASKASGAGAGQLGPAGSLTAVHGATGAGSTQQLAELQAQLDALRLKQQQLASQDQKGGANQATTVSGGMNPIR